MRWPVIHKSAADRAGANLKDYDAETAAFTWETARAELTGLPEGGLNIAHEALDRHIRAGRGARPALRWIGRDDTVREFSYAELTQRANRFASLLRSLEVKPGDRVYAVLGRIPELYIAALGTLKAGAAFTPLFSAFGPEPLQARMEIGEVNVLVTTEALYHRKIESWREAIPSLRHVLLTGCLGLAPACCIDLAAALVAADPVFETVATRPEDMALLHFTSGTTGRPPGAAHVHEAVVAHHVTGRTALDLRPGVRVWGTGASRLCLASSIRRRWPSWGSARWFSGPGSWTDRSPRGRSRPSPWPQITGSAMVTAAASSSPKSVGCYRPRRLCDRRGHPRGAAR
nr:AMP-binding protein [Caulobacter sp. 602-1]